MQLHSDRYGISKNSSQRSVDVIFPSSCLYLNPDLGACIVTFQPSSEQEDTFTFLLFSCLGELECVSLGVFCLD